MKLSHYAEYAVRLVNSEGVSSSKDALTTLDSVHSLLSSYGGAKGQQITLEDLSRLRAIRTRLRNVFTAASERDTVRIAALLNALLLEFPASAQVYHRDLLANTKQRESVWILRISDRTGMVSSTYAAKACLGLAIQLAEYGMSRLGSCDNPKCRNVYLDASVNRSRRYCSRRCSTRINVARYRSRKRAEISEPK
ncbi:CGNR zinc finger domain-containing protein [Streptomyces sp. NPDC127084]|uniref:CGNR zinc finger domain-containing protein n=1 Tax=Streptomyces sp. NPDC127084 TaxID=3347133 RepID=UPI003667E935